MTDHTKGPWLPLGQTAFHSPGPGFVTLKKRDYERARVCVNACAGIPTELLTTNMDESDSDVVIAQRIRLRAALAPFRKG